ncbi:MAG: hypothetical protein KKF20_07355 [Bacteroidetes bacterium]|nr:hypothetical protein [Bacteroidota bacterium]MBU2472210.1 hypothetical protein [Bacteroidota bacterium]
MNVAYVDDEVHGHIQAAKLGRTGERYVLGGENLTIKESFDRISKQYFSSQKLRVQKSGMLTGMITSTM